MTASPAFFEPELGPSLHPSNQVLQISNALTRSADDLLLYLATLALRLLLLRPTHGYLHTQAFHPWIRLPSLDRGSLDRGPLSSDTPNRRESLHSRPRPRRSRAMGGHADYDRRGGKGGKKAGGGRGRAQKAAAGGSGEQRDVLVSKKLSYVLRHGARDAGLAMDERGFVSCADLVRGCCLLLGRCCLYSLLSSNDVHASFISRTCDWEWVSCTTQTSVISHHCIAPCTVSRIETQCLLLAMPP